MKIWIVRWQHSLNIIGVFKSKEDAIKYILKDGYLSVHFNDFIFQEFDVLEVE